MWISVSLTLAVWLQTPQPAAADAVRGLTEGVVRICSVEMACEEFKAADVERLARPAHSPRRAGQLAFVDPATGMLVEPTREQLEELQSLILVDERIARSAQPLRVETLADGTVKADVRHLAVHRRATVLEAHPTAAKCAAGRPEEEGRP